MGGKFHPKLNLHSRLIENKYREGKVKRTLKRELKVPEISGSEADGTGFPRLDCCAQGTPYLHFARVVGLLSCNVSRCGYQRTVAVRAGVRLLDRCLRVARGAFFLLSWCERCVSILCAFGPLTHGWAQISARAHAMRPIARLGYEGAGGKVVSDPS